MNLGKQLLAATRPVKKDNSKFASNPKGVAPPWLPHPPKGSKAPPILKVSIRVKCYGQSIKAAVRLMERAIEAAHADPSLEVLSPAAHKRMLELLAQGTHLTGMMDWLADEIARFNKIKSNKRL
jgi:hypothetical protein